MAKGRGLTVSRKNNERIVIETSDGLILITLYRERGLNRARFESPESVKIWREEIWRVLAAENSKTPTPQKGEA